MQITTVLPTGTIGLAALAICGSTIAWRLPRVRGTTLTAPFCWAAASTAALAWVEAARVYGTLDGLAPLTRSTVTYLAACTTFCPLMAVLGAKRPQDRPWQWIVASLWLILAAPALQSLIASSGRYLLLSGPWRWFVILLIAVGLAVYWPTRFRTAAILASAGQAALLSPVLFRDANDYSPQMFTTGCVLLGVATLLAASLARRDNSEAIGRRAPRDLTEVVSRWLWFRDRWGALWALRVMLRVNQTAELQQWPVRLSLRGIERVDERSVPSSIESTGPSSNAASPHAATAGQAQAATAQQIEAALDAVLRRFERHNPSP